MKENKNTPTEEVEVGKQSFAKWLDNYWYHYKWHTIAVVFVIIVAIVCTVQLVNRTDYDAVIAYAGSKDVSITAKDGDVAEIVTLQTSLKDVIADVDENGETRISLTTLYWLSEKEISELSKNNESADPIIFENDTKITNMMLSSEYFLWFMSDDLYEYINGKSDVGRFVDLASMPDGDSTAEFYGEDTCAIYLKSTEFYKMPGICDLPEDTLIVVRRLGIGANKGTKRAYETALDTAKEIINYEY